MSFLKKISLAGLSFLLSVVAASAATDYSGSRSYFRNNTKTDVGRTGNYVDVSSAYALNGDILHAYIKIVNSGDTDSVGNVTVQRTGAVGPTMTGTAQYRCNTGGDTGWVDLSGADWSNFNSATQFNFGTIGSEKQCVIQYYLDVGSGNNFDTALQDIIRVYDNGGLEKTMSMNAYVPHFKIESASDSSDTVVLKFAQALETTGAQTITNYAISTGGLFTALSGPSTAVWNAGDRTVTLAQSQVDFVEGQDIYVRTTGLRADYGTSYRYLNTADYTTSGTSIAGPFTVTDTTGATIVKATYQSDFSANGTVQIDWDEAMQTGTVTAADFTFSDASTFGTSPTLTWPNSETLRINLDADGNIVNPGTTTIRPAVGNGALDLSSNAADASQAPIITSVAALNVRPTVNTFTLGSGNLVGSTRYCPATTITISSFTASDSDGTVSNYLINESSAIPAPGAFSLAAAPANYTLTDTTQNSHILYSWALDNGNAVSNSKRGPLVYDAGNPSVGVDIASGDYHAEQTITFSCSDAVTDCHEAYYTTDGSNPASSGTRSIFSDGYKVDLNADTTLRLYAEDRAGNSDSLTETYTFSCDPATVANGTVASYPDCSITCGLGYTLVGNSCVAAGGGGGGGGGGSCSNISSVYQMSTASSTTTLNLYRYLGFADTAGNFTSPVHQYNCYNDDYTVDYPKDLLITTATAEPFTGHLKAPSSISIGNATIDGETFPSLGALSLDASETGIKFDNDFKITIPYDSSAVSNISLLNVYWRGEGADDYILINTARTVNETAETISVEHDELGTYAVFESEGEVELQSVELQSVEIAEPFTDIAGHWAEEFIEMLRLMGVIHGKSPGIFGPDLPITRAELVKIVTILFEIPLAEEITEKPFPDVELNEWFATYISSAKEAGIVDGYPDGTFKPNQYITRVEALKILLEASGLEIVGGDMDFPDTIPGQWYEKYVAFAQANQIVNGYAVTNVTESATLFSNTPLQFGDYNDDVQKLQQTLAKIGYYDGQDTGYFGSYTQGWVKQLQADYPTETASDPAGVVGAATAAKIAELAGLGGKSETMYLFKPAQNVTRAEVSKMAVLTFNLKNSE